MTNLKHLSNEELINKYSLYLKTWSHEEHDERIALKNELLRRLNEPWRQIKNIKTVIPAHTKDKIIYKNEED